MTNTSATDMLAGLLDLTLEDELDCDGFLERIAAFVEGNIEDAALRALMAHHSELCPECSEELAILRRALEDA